MSLAARATADLIRIVAAGGGLRLPAMQRTTDDLVRIAAAAALSGSRVFLLGMSPRATDDLIRIGAAGKGNVVFED